jgi:MFS family permease
VNWQPNRAEGIATHRVHRRPGDPAIRHAGQVSEGARPTRWLEAASTAWTGGEAVYLVGLIVYAYGIGGAAAVSIVALLQALPAAVLAPIAMAATERFSRRGLTMLLLGARAGSIALAAGALAASWPAAVVFGLVTVDAFAAALLRPLRSALVPMLARSPDELVTANVAITVGASAAGLVGPAVAAVVLVSLGVEAAFLAGAAGFAMAVAFAARLRVAGGDRARHSRSSRRAGGTLAVLVRLEGARTIAAVIVGQRFVRGMLTVLVATTAIDLLAAGDGAVGVLNAAIGLGGLAGSVLAIAFIGRLGLAGAFALSVAMWGIGLAAPGVAPVLAVAVGAFALSGVGKALIEVTGASLLQRTIPAADRGAVLSVLESLVTGALAAGAVAASLLVEGLGPRGALLAAGGLTVAVVAVSLPGLGRVEDRVVVPERELRVLRGVPFFRPLQLTALEDLASSVETVQVAAGTEVIRQGEPGDRFYIVEAGGFETIIDGVPVRELGPGDSFGEIALLRDVPRTATVRAVGDATLAALAREDFLRAVTGHVEAVEAADAVVRSRHTG